MVKYDYQQLYVVFSKIVADQGMTMIELNSSGRQPKPPFVAFDIISPYIPTTWREDDSSNAFECVVSFTVYALKKVDALSRSSTLRSSLSSVSVLDAMVSANVVIVDCQPTQIRYVQETNNVAAMVGFDVRLRLKGEPEETAEPITKITFKEM